MAKSAQIASVEISSPDRENTEKEGKKYPSGHVLDSPEYPEKGGAISYTLAEIMALLRLKPTMKTFEMLALDLSKIAKQEPIWKKKYVHSVYHGWVLPSPKFAWAVDTLAQMIDDSPAAGMVYIKALAMPDIPEGALIPANAKHIKCARPGCPVVFVKTHPRQIYHDPKCSPSRSAHATR